jgi:pyruvate dehydrogenase E1 component beta subunit
MQSVARTHHAIVVEESPPVCGIAAEVAVNIHENAFDQLDAPIERVSGADAPMPYAKNLEHACIPHAEEVVAAVHKSLGR